MKCPHCKREDYLAVFRVRRKIEYKLVETREGKTKTTTDGFTKFRKGMWREDNDEIGDNAILRCNRCDEKILRNELEEQKIGDYSIDLKKGVMFYPTNMFADGPSIRKENNTINRRLLEKGAYLDDGGEDATKRKVKRYAEVIGTLEDLGVNSETDFVAIENYIENKRKEAKADAD